jgi:hypothetical protein
LKPDKFKIWYIHQIPGKAWEREVPDPATGQLILDAIYDVALYQYATGMTPNYANAGGISYLDEEGDWIDYHPEEWEDEA